MLRSPVPPDRSSSTRDALIAAGTNLIRRQGYVATTVDQICEKAGVTKGGFFHHFKTKEQLVEACLGRWDQGGAAMEARGAFQQLADPRERVLGYMDFYINVFENPDLLKSCLAGTTAQEVADTNPVLRDAANTCFVNAVARFKQLLDETSAAADRPIDTASLASLWMATIQGSLILSKASQDSSVIRRSLEHIRTYIAGHLPNRRKSPTKPRKD